MLLIDNGAEFAVKQVISYFDRPVTRIIRNEENIYVNPAWNQILGYFLRTEFEHLVIMNSDLIMQPGWSKALRQAQHDISCIPTDGSHLEDVEVFEGTPGVFIHLTREMAKLVYPIPTPPLVWFGDQWIYTRLRQAGYKTVIKSALKALHYHNGSQTVQRVPGISEIIEQDKAAWAKIGI